MALNNGATAIATTTDAAETAITLPTGAEGYYNLTIDNSRSAVEGWWSSDGGTTWQRLGASSVVYETDHYVTGSIKVKRIASGSNLANIWAWMSRCRRAG